MERVFLIRSEDSTYVCPSINATVSLARKFLEMGEAGGEKLCIETRSKESFDSFLNDTSATEPPGKKRKYKKREKKEKKEKKVVPIATKRGRKRGTPAKIMLLLGRKGELAVDQLQGDLGITGEAVRQNMQKLIAQKKVEISGEKPRTFKLKNAVSFQCAARGRKIDLAECVPNGDNHDCEICDYKNGD